MNISVNWQYFAMKILSIDFDLLLHQVLKLYMCRLIFKVSMRGICLNYVNGPDSIMFDFSYKASYYSNSRYFQAHLNQSFYSKTAHANMPWLSQNCRDQAISMLKANASVIKATQRFGCIRVAIYDFQILFEDTGRSKNRRKIARIRVSTSIQDSHIRLLHLRNRFRTVVNTAAETPGRANN